MSSLVIQSAFIILDSLKIHRGVNVPKEYQFQPGNPSIKPTHTHTNNLFMAGESGTCVDSTYRLTSVCKPAFKTWPKETMKDLRPHSTPPTELISVKSDANTRCPQSKTFKDDTACVDPQMEVWKRGFVNLKSNSMNLNGHFVQEHVRIEEDLV